MPWQRQRPGVKSRAQAIAIPLSEAGKAKGGGRPAGQAGAATPA